MHKKSIFAFLWKKLLCFLSLSLLMNLSFAVGKDDNRAPRGCHDTGYKFELKTLVLLPPSVGEVNSMYFIFNYSNNKINLFQMRPENSAQSMYLNHSINPSQWAVFATSEPKVQFICTRPDLKNPYGTVVDCSKQIRICEYTKIRYGLNNRGNYWLLNHNTRNDAVRAVVRYGIIPVED